MTSLRSLREHDGISHAKLLKARPILELDVVAAESSGPEDEKLAAAAYKVIHCVLTVGALSVQGDVKQLLAMELNLDGSLAPSFAKRQIEIVARLHLWGQDYKNESRGAYERLASTLTLMRRSPCSEGIEAAELAAFKEKHRIDDRTDFEEGFDFLWRRLLLSHTRDEADEAAREVLEKLTGLRRSIRHLTGSDFGDPMDSITIALIALRSEFGPWMKRYARERAFPADKQVDVDDLFKRLAEAGRIPSGSKPKPGLDWGIDALDALTWSLEERGAWGKPLRRAMGSALAHAEVEAEEAVDEALPQFDREIDEDEEFD